MVAILFLARKFFLGVGVLALLHGCTTVNLMSGSNTVKADASVMAVQLNVSEAMRKISKVRESHGLGAISTDPRLMKAANNHAKYLGRTGKFGHEFGPSTRFKKRIFDVGFKQSAGENIGVGYRNIDAAITGWMNSPKHRDIMLKRKFSVGGIALKRNTSGKNPRYTYYWVLIMGSGSRHMGVPAASL
ncbi:MAG: CAP domain-containing protein [Rhizobiaceae bacterium]|nr:CAP domain-containing protein [Rhizobiaceae bacterium]